MNNKQRPQEGTIALMLLILLLFLCVAFQGLMMSHRSVFQELERANLAKNQRLDAEGIRNVTHRAAYMAYGTNPTGRQFEIPATAHLDVLANMQNAFHLGGASVTSYNVHGFLNRSDVYPFGLLNVEAYDSANYEIPRHLESLLSVGPVNHMGSITFEYNVRYDNKSTAFDRKFDVEAYGFVVPIVNFPIVLYGDTRNGAIQTSRADIEAATMLLTPSFLASNGAVLLNTMLNPNTEPAVHNAFYDSADPSLPRMYLHSTQLSWALYEKINSHGWRNQFRFAAGAATIDMGAWESSTLAGVDVQSESQVVINLDLVTAQVLYIATTTPGTTIEFTGSGQVSDAPLIVMIYNAGGYSGEIFFSQSNNRALMVYNDRMDVRFQNGIDVRGALFLKSGGTTSGTQRLCRVRGQARLFGHISIDAVGDRTTSYFSEWGLEVLPDISVRNALLPYSPAGVLIGTKTDF